MRSDGRPEISAVEVREAALVEKIYKFLDNEKMQSFAKEYGITKDNLLNEKGECSDFVRDAFNKASEQLVPVIQQLIQEELGLELPADEAIIVLKSVVHAKISSFTFAEASAEPAPVSDTTPEADTSLVADLTPEEPIV